MKQPTPTPGGIPEGATPMTPLELNGIRLDVRHTVLTPDYLEQLAATDNAKTT